MSADPPLLNRRARGNLSVDDHPVRLPHLDASGSEPLFLGIPMDADLFTYQDLPLWQTCDGSRALTTFTSAQRETIERWHSRGLIVAAGSHRAGNADVTVISPHPDDAQLAVGALIATGGGRVVDIFTHETWTRQPYYQTRPELTARLLLEEEHASCQVLRAELTLLNYVDGAARPAWADGFLVAGREAQSLLAEPELLRSLVRDLGSALSGTGPLLVPLGVGGHVDHIYAREAVMILIREDLLDPSRVAFYEDMPYTVFNDAAAAAAALSESAELGALTPRLVISTAAAAERKREALWSYRLQVAEGIASRVIRYGTRLSEQAFAERLWVPAAASGLNLPAL